MTTPTTEKEQKPRARPLLWIFAGMLFGLLLTLLLFFLYGRQPAAVAPHNGTEAALPPQDLLAMQRAQNKGLEEEIRRLQAALRDDPCALPGILGVKPENTPLSPDYAEPAPSANATNPRPGTNGTAPRPLPAPAPSTVSELMDRATVFVVSESGGKVGMGSGFFVAPGVIATNRHVVQDKGATVYVGNKALGGMHAAGVIAVSGDASRDYALLRVPPALAGRAPVLRIAESVSRTDHVSAWGFPGYITEIDPKLAALARGDESSVPEVVYSEGVVSVILERRPPVILHTASISQGNSGGPLINAQGSVVGINTFIKAADQSRAQANIALPGRDLALFMRENGIAASTPSR